MILCVLGKNSVALHPFLNSLPKAFIHWILVGNYELSCMSKICLYCLRLVLGEESLMDTDQTVDSPRSHSTGNKQRRFKGGGSLLTPWAVSGDSGARSERKHPSSDQFVCLPFTMLLVWAIYLVNLFMSSLWCKTTVCFSVVEMQRSLSMSSSNGLTPPPRVIRYFFNLTTGFRFKTVKRNILLSHWSICFDSRIYKIIPLVNCLLFC